MTLFEVLIPSAALIGCLAVLLNAQAVTKRRRNQRKQKAESASRVSEAGNESQFGGSFVPENPVPALSAYTGRGGRARTGNPAYASHDFAPKSQAQHH